MTNETKFYINKCIKNMESNDEFYKNDIKICTYYFFNNKLKLKILII